MIVPVQMPPDVLDWIGLGAYLGKLEMHAIALESTDRGRRTFRFAVLSICIVASAVAIEKLLPAPERRFVIIHSDDAGMYPSGKRPAECLVAWLVRLGSCEVLNHATSGALRWTKTQRDGRLSRDTTQRRKPSGEKPWSSSDAVVRRFGCIARAAV